MIFVEASQLSTNLISGGNREEQRATMVTSLVDLSVNRLRWQLDQCAHRCTDT
jgi:hypothetical protein